MKTIVWILTLISVPVVAGEPVAFVSKSKEVTGSYVLSNPETRPLLKLTNDFKTSGGIKNVHVMVSPTAVEDLTDENAPEGGKTFGALTKEAGMQMFFAFTDMKLDQMKSVIIYDHNNKILHAAAPLKK